MWQTCLSIQILLSCIYSGQCRRYDIQSEAIKLYGEDLKNLLMRFRRSPEYLAILNDMIREMAEDFQDLQVQMYYAYIVKLKNRVTEILLENEKAAQDNKKKKAKRRTQSDETTSPTTRTTTTISPVEKLDNHGPLLSELTAAEKNFYKDLGFKFAGDAIHELINEMLTTAYEDSRGGAGGDGGGVGGGGGGGTFTTESHIKSTLLEKEETFITTTEHVKEHEVTSEHPPEDSTVAGGDEVVTVPSLYRYVYRAANDSKGKYHRKPHRVKTAAHEEYTTQKARRYGEVGPDTQSLVYQPKSIFNDWVVSYEMPEYTNISTIPEIVGQKKFKSGVYEAETRILGAHRHNNYTIRNLI